MNRLLKVSGHLAVVVAGLAASGAALAGECPLDKRVEAASTPASPAAKGVTDTVLTAIDLASEPAHVAARKLRLRRLVIEPGGVVPWHSHGDRPAIIFVVSGEATEYASVCSVPIVHRAGEATPETHATSHWWRNAGKTAAVLLSADLPHDESDHAM